MKSIVMVTALLLLAGCATGGDGRPDWLDGRSQTYPETRYLTATATATESESAKMRALSNLAKIFEVRIDESSRDEAAAWQRTGGDGEVQQGTEQLTVRYVDAYTTKLLEGAEIAETWREPADGRYHALAVIDRPQLVRRLSGDIRAADRYAQNMVARANRAGDPLAAARALWAGRKALIQREQLQRDLQIVDATGAGIAPQWQTGDLAVRIDAQLDRMRVGSRVLLDPVGDLDAALQAGIEAAGMRPAGDDAAPDYRLEAKLDVQDEGLRDGWYWFRGALEVALVETGEDTPRASHRWPLKASGQSRDQARVRLEDQIDRFLQTELKGALLNFGDDQSPQQQGPP